MSRQVFKKAKDTCRNHYETALIQYGDSPKGVNWKDAESQNYRFQMLCEVGKLSDKKIHDVGCGLGHLSDFLSVKGINCEYIGSDISPLMIRAAKDRLPTAHLYVADLLENKTQDWMRADYLITSGLFYVKTSTVRRTWKHFVQAMLIRMFMLSDIGIAFNMLTSFVDYEDSNLFYQPPGETVDFCIRNMSRRVVLRHDYPLWEYTVYVYK